MADRMTVFVAAGLVAAAFIVTRTANVTAQQPLPGAYQGVSVGQNTILIAVVETATGRVKNCVLNEVIQGIPRPVPPVCTGWVN